MFPANGDKVSQANSSDEWSAEEFKSFCISIIGLSQGSADGYASYVKGAARIVGSSPDGLVHSDSKMESALSTLNSSEMNRNTRRNYIVGIKTYYRFVNGYEYGTGDVQKKAASDIPFELRNQINAVELRLSDSEADFWHKTFDVVLLAVTLVPTILAVNKGTPLALIVAVVSMIFGLLGLAAIVPVLRRPIRQLRELYEHGKELAEGKVSVSEFTPQRTTVFESVCSKVVMVVLPLSLLGVVVAVSMMAFGSK